MTTQTRAIAMTVLAGVALLALLWFAAIGPKRSERSEVRDNVAVQQGRVDAAKAQLTSYTAARRQFPGLLSELRELDKAVPARGAVSSLLRQVQRRARVRDSDLRLVSLKGASASRTPATATAAPPATPGAVAGPGGLSALPFTFEFTGSYFDLVDILKAARRAVREKAGDLTINGRLLSIDGLAFERVKDAGSLTKAVVNATAYIAPDGAASPRPPAEASPPVAKEVRDAP